MEDLKDLTFRQLFFRLYDRKISDGTVTFSQTGIRKDDFTRLCTDPSFVLDRDTVVRLSHTLHLTGEEAAALLQAAGYGADGQQEGQ
jgi:hypothetical protein